MRRPHEHRNTPSRLRARARCRGLSLAEMLVSLAITALLLTATMVAIDASFKSYAIAAESTSTQVSTRMVTHRVLALIRNGTAQGPLTTGDHATFGSGLPTPTFTGDVVTSSYLILTDPDNQRITLEYRAADEMLYVTTDGSGTPITYPLLGGVTACEFRLERRRDASTDYVWVLQRASVDMTVQPDIDTTLAIESGNSPPIRVITTTAPRRLR